MSERLQALAAEADTPRPRDLFAHFARAGDPVEDTSRYSMRRERAKWGTIFRVEAINGFQKPRIGQLVQLGQFEVAARLFPKMASGNAAHKAHMNSNELLARAL
ncbi:MAG: hypothetical protein WDM89_06915 [Rhizomicrobium sp.]